MSPDIRFTYGINRYDTRWVGGQKHYVPPEELSASWPDYIDLLRSYAAISRRLWEKDKSCPWTSPMLLAGDGEGRGMDNVTAVASFACVDLDAPGWTLDDLNSRLDGFERLFYTTTQSRPDHQRWRILTRLDRELAVEEHGAIWTFLDDLFDGQLDHRTRNANRILYVPAQWDGADNLFEAHHGLPVSVDVILEHYKPVEIATYDPIGLLPGDAIVPDGTQIITSRMAQSFAFAGQTLSAKAENVVGQFNSLLKGKAAVMLDETENDKVNESTMKHTLGREKLTINEKGIPQYEIDNTPLYLISSNKSEGGIWLDRSQADRRYSVLHVRKGQPLQYWIARHQGWISQECQFLGEQDPAYARAWQWLLSEGAAILRNRCEVANWLGRLLLQYGDDPQPLPLHGADFGRLMEIQTPIWERIAQAVFNDPNFSHIERSVLYRGYRALGATLGQRPVSDKKFFEKVREWVERHHPEVVEGKVRQSGDRTPRLWYSTLQFENARHRDNAERYVVRDGYADRWMGPEV